MSERHRLPNRRASESFGFECGGMAYVATISRFPNGDLAEVFLTNHKVGSGADAAARDSAVVASIAMQHGAPAEVLRHAVLCNADGTASGPLGTALDLVAASDKAGSHG
jgi:hypothetical protein